MFGALTSLWRWLKRNSYIIMLVICWILCTLLCHGGKSGVNFMYGTIAGPYGANAQALMCAQECQCFCCICAQHKSGGFRARVWAQRTRGALTSRNDDRRNVARGHNHLL